ncbi:MAG: glycosyltransferase family 2 protein [Tissierellia bacterium]|nr:glycosyltransferase family 2 protein [Tissierellia bacterium]MDD4781128.1 glycosyltransferase family 2 protein [Tissierellia bacterium]
MKKIVIIPAYNERNNLTGVINDLKINAPDFDYVIVNDGSTDDTLTLCSKHNLNVINLPVNLGIGASVQTGFIYALGNGYDIAVQFDGDGQHDAKYLHKMYDEMIKTNSDMVIGSRYIIKDGFQSTKLRRAGIRILSKLIKILHKQEIKDVTSGLRMINNKVMEAFVQYYPYDYPEPETIALCIRKKYKITEVPVTMRARNEGNSSINSIQSIYYMLKVSFSIIVDFFKKL